MYYPSFETVQRLQEEARASDQPGKPLLPLCCDLLVDLETPVSAYCKTARGAYSFLLESVTGGERVGRYSFIGIDPYLVSVHHGETATLYYKQDNDAIGHDVAAIGHDAAAQFIAPVFIPCRDPLQLVEDELGQYRLITPDEQSTDELPYFHGGAVGYLSYEAASRF